ncbi:unnamed protein product [Wuchereria bancrofti]|uniref:Uncharacterized protein n=1 Tax=Wuchereria bancrofti TaxID=6293 RepID=A0A3P7DYT3_WUCBA|nr:unnamed protein product [Wuchereria bancrofti]
MDKLVTKAGQKFIPAPGYDDLKLEAEINDLYKDKESILSTEHEILKAKEGKGKVEKKEEKDQNLTATDEDGKFNDFFLLINLSSFITDYFKII